MRSYAIRRSGPVSETRPALRTGQDPDSTINKHFLICDEKASEKEKFPHRGILLVRNRQRTVIRIQASSFSTGVSQFSRSAFENRSRSIVELLTAAFGKSHDAIDPRCRELLHLAARPMHLNFFDCSSLAQAKVRPLIT